MVITHVKLVKYLQLKLESELLRTPASYILDIYSIKSFIIPKGQTVFSANDCFSQNFAPEQVVMGLQLLSKAVGEYSSSPFAYDLFDLQEAYLTFQEYNIPSIPFRFDFANDGTALRPFLSLFGNDSTFEDNGLLIDMANWKKNYPLMRFDMMNCNKHCSDALLPRRLGNVKFFLRLKGDYEAIKVVLFYKNVETLQIDSQRQILKNFSF